MTRHLRVALLCVALLASCTNIVSDGGGGDSGNSDGGWGRDVPIFLDDGGAVTNCPCNLIRVHGKDGCVAPIPGWCRGCPIHCAGISQLVCGVPTAPSNDTCVDALPDGGFYLLDGGLSVTPLGQGSRYAYACEQRSCGEVRCSVYTCRRNISFYCVSGGTYPGCNSPELPQPTDGGDAGCDWPDTLNDTNISPSGTGCAAPLPDGGWYLGDGGINLITSGASPYIAILVPSANCPWLWRGSPTDCRNTQFGQRWCAPGCPSAGYCNASVLADGGIDCDH